MEELDYQPNEVARSLFRKRSNIIGLIVYKIYKRSMAICPACGTAQSAEHLYCSACGAQLGKRCESCGCKVGAKDSFCHHCGNKI